jgi:hypothetical protein
VAHPNIIETTRIGTAKCEPLRKIFSEPCRIPRAVNSCSAQWKKYVTM